MQIPPGAQICPLAQSAETAQPVVGLTHAPAELQVCPAPHWVCAWQVFRQMPEGAQSCWFAHWDVEVHRGC
jgi:hypothetical protein